MNSDLLALLTLPRSWPGAHLPMFAMQRALCDSAPGRALGLRIAVLELVENSQTVMIHGVTDGDVGSANPYHCAPQAFTKLVDAAVAACRLSLGEAQSAFRLLARLCPEDFPPRALLLGLKDGGRGLGFLVLDITAPLSPDECVACGEILGGWFAMSLARHRDSMEMLARLAELSQCLAPPGVTLSDLGRAAVGHAVTPALDDVTREHIRRVVAECGGRISGPRGAAQRLAVNANTLRARMRRLGLLPACRARDHSGSLARGDRS